MPPLATLIRRAIGQTGPMSVADYMALCLGHPEHGYYRTRDPLGAGGDFTTAPEISQMFGELIGLWLAQVWLDMGAPAQAALVELGPGRGALMADILRAARAAPGFAEAVEVWLVETSPALRARQAGRLAPHDPHWAATLAEVPEGPVLLVANEFFDALPIRQFVKAGDLWRERMIGLDARDALAFGLSPAAPAPGADHELNNAPDGAIAEICPLGEAITAQIGARLARAGGAALIVDYGYDTVQLARAGGGDTFQAISAHAYADPLAAPGEADLTAHVNFGALARAARAAGARAAALTTQGALLEALGIRARAQALSAGRDAATAAGIMTDLRRLTAPQEMGTLFKALALTAPGAPTPPGFAQRRERDERA